jgi:hypothetical protein
VTAAAGTETGRATEIAAVTTGIEIETETETADRAAVPAPGPEAEEMVRECKCV